MSIHSWVQEIPVAVTVCDTRGVILEMNDQAGKVFKKEGGQKLIGSNVLDCHPQPARGRLQRLLESGERNVYMILKEGRRKLVYQVPWFEKGRYQGFVELVMEVPDEIPTFLRK
ncbi:MAG: PAS domain-containing protein [Acidobacteriota bacterium]